MKTAISVPDQLFRAAENMARKMGLSRSKLYSDALSDYLSEHKTDDVTERLNRIYSEQKASVDTSVRKMQSRTIGRSSW